MGFRHPAAAAWKMLAAALGFASTALAAGGPAWYPASVEAWAKTVNGANQVCQEGYQQSPVDLPGCNMSSRPTRPAINVTWADQNVTITNNGHTVQLTPEGSSKGQMSVNIAGTIKTYTLLQCHFHWGSEHVVDGVQSVMELHCVHTEDVPLGDVGKYGVLGILYELGSASTFLSQFEDHLPTHEDALLGRLLSDEQQHQRDLLGNPVDPKSWRRLAGNGSSTNTSSYTGPISFLDAIVGIDRTHYWNYDGSFTTPPCTEIVDWYNLMGKATLSQAQLDKFKYAQGWSAAGGNFRNAQPLHSRTIYGCDKLPQPVVNGPWYPYNADTWASGTINSNRVCKDGAFQSPIDFETCAMPSSRTAPQITWPTQPVSLTNNGHTVQITAQNSGAARGKMVFGKKSYTLIQCHWHWGSEHRIGGLQLPLEVHCVHQLDGTQVAPSYGVFGVFYELSNKENSFLKRFEDQLPSASRRLDETEDQVHGLNLFGDPIANGSKARRLASVTTSSYTGPLDMQGLFHGVDLTNYWDYEGSFTTPPCTEAVDFYIMIGRAGMTMAQLNKFKAAIGWDTLEASGNFRPPQPLMGRTVSGCESVNLPNPPVDVTPIVEEESCPNQAPLITLQVVTGACVLLILLVFVIAAFKAATGSGTAAPPKNDQAQVYGKSDEDVSAQKKAVTSAELEEALKALLSDNVSDIQSKGEESSKLMLNALELAKEVSEYMPETTTI